MIDPAALPPLLQALPLAARIALGLAAGALGGALFFGSLRHVVSFCLHGNWQRLALWQLLRFALLGLLLYALARIGAATLLSAAVAMVAARQWLLRSGGEVA